MRIALVAQRHGFTGQPFQITMLAIVDDGVCGELVLEPEIARKIAMGRHQIGIMIDRFFIQIITPRRLNQNGRIAELDGGQLKMVIAEERISCRTAPPFFDGILYKFR